MSEEDRVQRFHRDGDELVDLFPGTNAMGQTLNERVIA